MSALVCREAVAGPSSRGWFGGRGLWGLVCRAPSVGPDRAPSVRRAVGRAPGCRDCGYSSGKRSTRRCPRRPVTTGDGSLNRSARPASRTALAKASRSSEPAPRVREPGLGPHDLPALGGGQSGGVFGAQVVGVRLGRRRQRTHHRRRLCVGERQRGDGGVAAPAARATPLDGHGRRLSSRGLLARRGTPNVAGGPCGRTRGEIGQADRRTRRAEYLGWRTHRAAHFGPTDSPSDVLRVASAGFRDRKYDTRRCVGAVGAVGCASARRCCRCCRCCRRRGRPTPAAQTPTSMGPRVGDVPPVGGLAERRTSGCIRADFATESTTLVRAVRAVSAPDGPHSRHTDAGEHGDAGRRPASDRRDASATYLGWRTRRATYFGLHPPDFATESTTLVGAVGAVACADGRQPRRTTACEHGVRPRGRHPAASLGACSPAITLGTP